MKFDNKMKFYLTLSLIAIFLISISVIENETGQTLISETAQAIKGYDGPITLPITGTPDPYCGDNSCNGGETCSFCEDDCGACPTCGDGSCNGAETCDTCETDCGACYCGDGACNGAELCGVCIDDCGCCEVILTESNQVLSWTECAGADFYRVNARTSSTDTWKTTAYGDLPATQTNVTVGYSNHYRIVAISDGVWSVPSNEVIVGSFCGNSYCDGTETCSSCEDDCGPCPPTCGDGTCDVSVGETCYNCQSDCGLCCGDGVCDANEDCTSCETDCGACPTCFGDIDFVCTDACKVVVPGGYKCDATSNCSAACKVSSWMECETGGICCVNDTSKTCEEIYNDPETCFGVGCVGSDICGDGYCGVNEDCLTCSDDCPTCACIDSDFGSNTNVKGTATGINVTTGWEGDHVDTCYSVNDRVLEYYCNSEGFVSADTLDCASGYTCSDGKCVEECTDTDGGKNYYIKGTATAGDGTYSIDECNPSNSQELFERYCDGTEKKTEYYTCAGICTFGKCISSATCGDGVCHSQYGESSATCPEDCGGPVCGDGVCNGGETCSDCSSDCSECAYTGYIVGEAGTLLRTTDSGNTWVKIDISSYISSDSDLASLDFTNSNTAYTVGHHNSGFPRIFKTESTGISWSRQVSTPVGQEFYDVDFIDDYTGYAVGTDYDIVDTITSAVMYKTSNGGATWTTVVDNGLDNTFSTVDFIDANTGWAAGHFQSLTENNKIYHTTNGGNTWTKQNSGLSGFNSYIKDIDFIDANTGWAAAVGNGFETIDAVISTTDGGVTWIRHDINLPDYVVIRAIDFIDANTGWAAMNNGAIYNTIDGGVTWTYQFSGGLDLFDIQFINKNSGWAVGEKGIILHTINGGMSWFGQQSVTGETLNGVDFIMGTDESVEISSTSSVEPGQGIFSRISNFITSLFNRGGIKGNIIRDIFT